MGAIRSMAVSLMIAAWAADPVLGQEASPEETLAYQAWYAANGAKDVAKAYDLAQAYLTQYPQGSQAAFLGQWKAGARGVLFNQAIQNKDVGALLRLGKERLAEDPSDLTYSLSLALNLRRLELFASPANHTHAKEAAEFSRLAVERIEAGVVPPGADPSKWSKGDALSWLHQNLAAIAYKQQNKDEALEHFSKSSAASPSAAGIVAYNTLHSGLIHKERYDQAVQRYQALPEAERQPTEPSEGARAAVQAANGHADAAIEAWARFMALAEAQQSYGDTRTAIGKALADLWAYRNPEDPEGYKKLVDQNRPVRPETPSN